MVMLRRDLLYSRHTFPYVCGVVGQFPHGSQDQSLQPVDKPLFASCFSGTKKAECPGAVSILQFSSLMCVLVEAFSLLRSKISKLAELPDQEARIL